MASLAQTQHRLPTICHSYCYSPSEILHAAMGAVLPPMVSCPTSTKSSKYGSGTYGGEVAAGPRVDQSLSSAVDWQVHELHLSVAVPSVQ